MEILRRMTSMHATTSLFSPLVSLLMAVQRKSSEAKNGSKSGKRAVLNLETDALKDWAPEMRS
jgi:hypothetical protein